MRMWSLMLQVSSKTLRYEYANEKHCALANDVANTETCLEMCPTQTAIMPSTEDVSISFLPLAHMFERVVQVRPGPVQEPMQRRPCC